MTEAKGQHGVGLAIKESILQDVQKDGLAVEYISARLMNVRLNLKGRSNGISFLCGWYAPTVIVTNQSETKTSVGPH